MFRQDVPAYRDATGHYPGSNDDNEYIILPGSNGNATDCIRHWYHILVYEPGRRRIHDGTYPIHLIGGHYHILCVADSGGMPERYDTDYGHGLLPGHSHYGQPVRVYRLHHHAFKCYNGRYVDQQ